MYFTNRSQQILATPEGYHDFSHFITTRGGPLFVLLLSEKQAAEAAQSPPISDRPQTVICRKLGLTQDHYSDRTVVRFLDIFPWKAEFSVIHVII